MKKNIKKKAAAKAPAKREAKPYKIEKSIPVAETVHRTGDGLPGRVAMTVREMAAGDSFLVKDATEALRAEKQMRDLLRRERTTGGKREFVARRVKNGTRIWRTK